MAGGRVEPSGYFTRVYLCGGDQRGPEGSRDVSWLYGHPGGMVVLLRGSWGGATPLMPPRQEASTNSNFKVSALSVQEDAGVMAERCKGDSASYLLSQMCWASGDASDGGSH